jgi:hypothetical protein
MDKRTEAIIAFLRAMDYQQIVAFPGDTHQYLQTAADLLERYAQNEARWRSAQQPPETDARVAVLYRWPGSRKLHSSVLDYYANDPEPHFQHALGEGGPIVMYWMPLPDEPEEGDA